MPDLLRAVIAAALCCVMPLVHAAPDIIELEQLTWTEVRARIAAGTGTVLIPIGGTEQSGPYIALGKHNVRARYFANAIARQIGHALVAPVISYVPEGSVKPPAAHMRFPGTISIPDPAFEAVLEGAARSFCQHGLHEIVFIGDHGGYQKNEQRVAERLNRAWSKEHGCRVHALPEYYQASQKAYADALKARGIGAGEIGVHAGLADTALTLAIDPAMVRSQAMARAPRPGAADGVDGDPRRASTALGQIGVERIVAGAVKALREALREPR